MKPLHVIPPGAEVTFGKPEEPTTGCVTDVMISAGNYVRYKVAYYDRDGDRCVVNLEAFEVDPESDDRLRVEFKGK